MRKAPVNEELPEDIMGSLFDLEQGLEKGSASFRTMLRELLDRIIEKRLEYYLYEPPEEP
ncbi:MAG: hypothetical protein JSV18_01540 [Candidatus Bathyarchaeota archaeon]|nr:MAG: hypothetical protein JSV18_01540 [Candidatus Bathyarchaeota archaeon]